MAKRTVRRLSIADLERMLAKRKQDAEKLHRERTRLLGQLEAIDRRLAAIASTKGPAPKRKRPGKRVVKKRAKRPGRKKRTLAEHVASILAGTEKPISPREVALALKKKGVSKSKYLSTQVQHILRQGKVAAKKVGRGQYVSG